MMGYFTPSEAGAVGTFAVLVLAVAKGFRFKDYKRLRHRGPSDARMLLMLIAGSAVLGHFIAVTNIPQYAADWVVALALNRYMILTLIMVIYLSVAPSSMTLPS